MFQFCSCGRGQKVLDVPERGGADDVAVDVVLPRGGVVVPVLVLCFRLALRSSLSHFLALSCSCLHSPFVIPTTFTSSPTLVPHYPFAPACGGTVSPRVGSMMDAKLLPHHTSFLRLAVRCPKGLVPEMEANPLPHHTARPPSRHAIPPVVR